MLYQDSRATIILLHFFCIRNGPLKQIPSSTEYKYNIIIIKLYAQAKTQHDAYRTIWRSDSQGAQILDQNKPSNYAEGHQFMVDRKELHQLNTVALDLQQVESRPIAFTHCPHSTSMSSAFKLSSIVVRLIHMSNNGKLFPSRA
ncbi:hypothetical protein AWZ03_012625 [Drosophila navojoa]|uniref:Uncharacterized protein n=1 Tax=Drosophila navojoa TaxID=7232 RepID=A0A484AZE5_DRONA|nr:hypothetical protein AWZ03_012625 [Drosophila navojoa]